MTKHGLRAVTIACAAMVLAMATAACVTTEQPTPIYLYVSPSPSATETASEETRESPKGSFTPWPTATPTPVPTPTPTPAPTAAPSATPTGPAGFCTGTASNQTFFLQAAKGVKATIYCATGLGSGWNLSAGTWSGNKSGGSVTVTYKYKKTTTSFTVQEGAFCLTDPVTCVGGPHPPAGSGTTSFDGKTAAFYSNGSGFIVAVAPGTTQAYMITATNVPQATVATIAANMKAVPKT